MDITKTEHGLWAVSIDGHTYEFSKFGAEEGFGCIVDLLSLIGAPLAAAAPGKNPDLPTDPSAITRSIGEALARMGSEKPKVIALVKNLTSGRRVFCDGKVVDFNTHYADRYGHMMNVLMAALEVQFGSFLGEGSISGLLGALAGGRKPETKPQAATYSGDLS